MNELHKTCETHFMTPARKQSCDYCEHKNKDFVSTKEIGEKLLHPTLYMISYNKKFRTIKNHKDVKKRVEQLCLLYTFISRNQMISV